MGLSDPILIDRWHDLYILKRGAETFFDPDTDLMITFETEEEAAAYAHAHMGVIPQLESEG